MELISKKNIRLFSSILLVVSVIIVLFITDWNNYISLWTLIALIIGTIGSVFSIFVPSNYTFSFKESDWKYLNKGYFIKIEQNIHQAGKNPKCQVFQFLNDKYQEVGVVIQQNPKGDITIEVNCSFDGKIIIN